MSENRQQRRLATILAADVFGYSRLMAENEEETLRTLKAHRAVTDHLIGRHDGRIFNTAGDSILAEFNSAVEAVRCAIAIQEELRVRNAQIHGNRRMDFRIGINVGDVLVDGENLYGDGVNIAARLESIAAPGNICISGSVFALVKNKLSYGFEDIGPQTVKNIPEPVPAYRLAPNTTTPEQAAQGHKSPSWRWPVVAALLLAVIVAAGTAKLYWDHQQASFVPAVPAVPAFTKDILKAEPPIGQLPTGTTVLVDDGTCPEGQIKKLVGGNLATGQPRLRSCVPQSADTVR